MKVFKWLKERLKKVFRKIAESEPGNGMAFFKSSITISETLVITLDTDRGVWSVINLLEGYGNDKPGANAHVR
ncbi:Maff2 family protein [Butyrivibrio hungatei DSM 14810]|uniref:Maff2 family protein n=1 Tax=Butyrivibrio hungatei DSM 14810 TaxID=1121132 RepID=A0A1M7S620_9FIRM|nr:Maff2 family protein [Butyrivibrio hungatei DSM 14810]